MTDVQAFADHIDQLDLALDQLAMNDRNFDRFALMLIDNVAELALHHHAAKQEKPSWARASKEQSEDKLLRAALGQRFDSKVKFAKSTGFISGEIADTILNAHAFRNTAYHRGVRHEGVLHSLALLYFKSVCTVLKACWGKSGWSCSSGDRVSHRAMKYLGLVKYPDWGRDWAKSFMDASDRLGEVASSMGDALVEDLAADMEKAIVHTDSALEYLEKNSPHKPGQVITRDGLIVDAQAWHFFMTEEAQRFALSHGCPHTTVGTYVDWLKANYPWPTRSDPIPSWRKRLDSILSEKNPHVALKKYCDFMSQTEDLRERINDSTAALDQHLDELAGR